MKLHFSVPSPFARKVLVVAHETGQEIETLPAAAHPITRDATVVAQNPTGQVPTAILPDGSPLYDSRVICRWLAEQAGGSLYPAGEALWTALRRESLGDSMIAATVLIRYETALRPEALRWPEWIRGQMEKVDSSLDRMEAEAGDFRGIDIGLITMGCALGYLDFRLAHHDWRKTRPALAAWFGTFAARPSMQATVPE